MAHLPHNHSNISARLLEHIPSQTALTSASELFHQLGESNRIRLFWILCHCEECVINLAAMMEMSSPALSHHLKVLKETGLIVSRREGKEVYYTASDSKEARLLHETLEALMHIVCPERKVLCYGEALWDVYPEKKVIGGAALNFGAHLSKQGVGAYLYTAIGKDDLGEEMLEFIHSQRVQDQYVCKVKQQTGVSLVTLHDGTPSYEIKLETAMDHIPEVELQGSFDAFYFGTLAQRCPESRETLKSILAKYSFRHVLFDINIRQTYYSKEVLEHGLEYATLLKVSREEMGVFREFGIAEDTEYEALCRTLSDKYPKLEIIIVTLDSDGAVAFDCKEKKLYIGKKPCCQVVSTVGAGDSFSATFLATLLSGGDIEKALTKAGIVSSYVVTQLGAVPEYPEGLL